MTPESGQISFSSLRSEIFQTTSGQVSLNAAATRLGYIGLSNQQGRMSDLYRCYGGVVTIGTWSDKLGTSYGYNIYQSAGSLDGNTVMTGVDIVAAYTGAFGGETIFFTFPMTDGFGANNVDRICRANELNTFDPNTGAYEGSSSIDLPYIVWNGSNFPTSGTSSIGLKWNANNSTGGGGSPPPGGEPPPPGGGCCFSNDTEITMADYSVKLINTIQIGDQILSYNPETQQNETNEVSEVITRVNRKMYEFHLENGTIIKGSVDHPFYVVGKGYCSMNPAMTMGGYKSLTNVQQIEIGDKLVDKDKNEIVIQDIVSINLFDTVYTFNNKYKTSPNFYANGVLVY